MAKKLHSYGSMLVVALPDGSLMLKDRGDMVGYVADMNIGAIGYNLPKPDSSPECGISWLRLYTDRPQNMGPMLDDEIYDIGILGDDWILENRSRAKPVIDMCTGDVSVTVGIPIDPKYDRIQRLGTFLRRAKESKKKIVCPTEYPVLATNILMGDREYPRLYGDLLPTVVFHGTNHSLASGPQNEDTSRLNPDVLILVTHGNTEDVARRIKESEAYRSFEPLVVDNVQTGVSMKKAGFRPLPCGIKSSAKLYVGSHVIDNEKKKELALRFMRMVDGVVFARTHSDVKFNVQEKDLAPVLDYMRAQHLFSQEPTVVPPHNSGKWFQIDSVMPASPPETWTRIQDELYNLGARTLVVNRPKQVVGIRGKDYERVLSEGLTGDDLSLLDQED